MQQETIRLTETSPRPIGHIPVGLIRRKIGQMPWLVSSKSRLSHLKKLVLVQRLGKAFVNIALARFRLTVEAANQQVPALLNEQTERELSDAELAQIKGAADIPLMNQYTMGLPFNRYVERFGG